MKKLLFSLIVAAMSINMAQAGEGTAKEYYNESCAKCHGVDGKGQTKMGQKLGAKDYTDAKVQKALTYEMAFKAIVDGFEDKDGKVVMKPEKLLSNTQVKELIEYMRKFQK